MRHVLLIWVRKIRYQYVNALRAAFPWAGRIVVRTNAIQLTMHVHILFVMKRLPNPSGRWRPAIGYSDPYLAIPAPEENFAHPPIVFAISHHISRFFACIADDPARAYFLTTYGVQAWVEAIPIPRTVAWHPVQVHPSNSLSFSAYHLRLEISLDLPRLVFGSGHVYFVLPVVSNSNCAALHCIPKPRTTRYQIASSLQGPGRRRPLLWQVRASIREIYSSKKKQCISVFTILC